MSGSFERETIDTLARIETKMDILVGEDGNGGRIADLELRMRTVERHSGRRKWRITGVASVASAAATGTITWLVRHFWH
jgi:hypothetical protein